MMKNRNNRLFDNSTLIFLVIGHPVAHSLSPPMHNAAFAQKDINAVYLAADIKEIDKGIDAIRILNVKGASITIPHKESVIRCLDRVDSSALEIGAVNTLINEDGLLVGYNSDAFAVTEAIKEKMPISGKEVLILGAGGAARSAAFGISKEGGHVTILSRNEEKGKELAERVHGSFSSKPESLKRVPEIIVNATPVGMHPNIDQTPFPKELFDPSMLVMDMVYNPLATRFLIEARKTGCKTIDGVAMFVRQGAFQFTLWTKKTAPTNIMEGVVKKILLSDGQDEERV